MSHHIITKTSNRKHRSSCFLGCFGFSVKDDEKKISAGGDGEKDKYGGQRIFRPYWFTRMKKSSAKTVPMNSSNFAPKLRSSKKIHVPKEDKNSYAINDQLPATAGGSGNNLNMVMAAEPDQIRLHKSTEATTDNGGEHIILKKTKTLGAENETIRNNTSRSTRKKLSKSMPEQGIYGRESIENHAKFGSLIGISVLMVILGIMLLWGKLCAILCAAIWFYCISSFRAQQRNEFNTKKGSSKEFDESNVKEHNKKVVLQGFLERSNQCK
ncbi:uncharacterized protein At5g23160-like [Olea europaea var. sylvestris]|uniref:uncharacterized protein At5g23160-like n=1 Tax=Olea europaea var. sylvestris TaxID=158386 RepID=UPI000C1D535D|nr:uncharacterized protein At5g23160-like [Olea europaea var. sylvestris]